MASTPPDCLKDRLRYVTPMLSKNDINTLFHELKSRFPGKSDRAKGPKGQPNAFRSCVSCMLSAQSLDRNTAKASTQLFTLADTPVGILALSDHEIVNAIKPCGLYNVKARNLRKLCAALIEDHDGVVPNTRKGLMSLPGIGRKCADIVMSFTFDEDVIAVDTHIHRVANRTGLASGKTEEQTAKSLEERAPDWAMRDGHFWLLNFGKQICKARGPDCIACPVEMICEKNGL
ncbi:MAG: endonuclease III [Pseudomonadota bacterium]